MVLEKKSSNEKKRMTVNILVWTSLVGTEPRASTKTMPQEEPGGGGEGVVEPRVEWSWGVEQGGGGGDITITAVADRN